MDLVIIPAWRRADFLLATLTRLEKAIYWERGGSPEIWICLDRRSSPDVLSVAHTFKAKHGARIRTVEHNYRGNSFNVLSAYQEAYNAPDAFDLIHLIEDDIFIGTDYFLYHRRAHELCPGVLAVSACRNQNADYTAQGHPSMVYLHQSYQSLGVSFKPQQLERILLHVRPEYFRDPVGYCREMFPDYTHGVAFAEQDGLIRRVGEFYGMPCVYPCVPRAYHAGFHGYNRKGKPLDHGSVEARAQFLLCATDAHLNDRAISHPDHQTIDLDALRPSVSRVLGDAYAVA